MQLYDTALRKWVKEVIQGRLWEQLADLHIDELDAQFKRSGNWIEGSLALLNHLASIVDGQQYEVLLVIPLATTTQPIAISALRLDTLEQYVGYTPPSLYLFPLSSEIVGATINSALQLLTFSEESRLEFYFQETQNDGEYDSALLVRPYRP